MKELRTRYKAAITVWEDRVSPVFESAGFLLIVRVNCGLVTDKMIISFDPRRLQELVDLFHRERISVLICGAITREQAEVMQKGGIRIIPFISGNQSDVLRVLRENRSCWDDIKMPGCSEKSKCRARYPDIENNNKWQE